MASLTDLCFQREFQTFSNELFKILHSNKKKPEAFLIVNLKSKTAQQLPPQQTQ